MKKTLLIIAGWLSLITGLIGMVLPLLPTTPFILLAAYLFLPQLRAPASLAHQSPLVRTAYPAMAAESHREP